MKKEIQITGQDIQSFMASLQINLPAGWTWEVSDIISEIPNSFYYQMNYQSSLNKTYCYSFLCKPYENSCKLVNVERLPRDANDDYSDEEYNRMVEKIYTDVISPKYESESNTVSIIVLEDNE